MTKRDELIAPGGVGAKVRELEWSYNNVAASSLGKYMIDGWGNGEFSIARPGRYDDGTRYPTLDAAKAAAQADYEQRILSALEAPAAGDGEPVARKRPVAFRVRQHRLSNHYELYTNEKDAQFWADDRGIEYEGLYLVADRFTAPPAPSVAAHRPLAWLHEDDLPDGYPYSEMHKYSEVRCGVRMFPVYAPPHSALITAPQDDVRDGPTLAMETRRADDNAESCRHFCAALRRIASGASDAVTIAADAVKMPWLLEPLPSDPTPSSRPEVSVEELAEAIWYAGFKRAFDREPPDPWVNQGYSVKRPHRDTARALKAKYHMEGR